MPLHFDYRQDALYQLGFREGYEKSREAAALVLLKRGMAAELVGEITGMTAEQVAQIQQQPEAGQ